MKGSDFILLVLLISCQTEKEWQFEEIIQLNDIKPLGIIVTDEQMWLTDVDRNRMIMTDLKGNLVETYPDLLRPMHIVLKEGKIYIPEFLRDTITILEGEHLIAMPLDIELDAPAGIDVMGNTASIVDFYNYRLILIYDGQTIIIGKNGHADGEFNYPTDVALFEDKIFVADAYNNRVQVFDYNGQVLKVIGWKENIRVATGLAVGPNRIYITDFHGNRVLMYDFNGTLLKIFTDHFDKPTDIFIHNNRMFVANYGGDFISVFIQK